MKIGDRIVSSRIRPGEVATIIKDDVLIKERTKKDGSLKTDVRTKYTAEYDDGSTIIFYGFDIGKSVKLADEECYEQLCLNFKEA